MISAAIYKKFSDERFSFEQAAAQAFAFYIGGFETTSSTLQFALYELAINPDIQTKVRKEIKHVLAKNKGELTYEAVMTEMEYLGRVFDGKKKDKTNGNCI